MKVSTGSAEEGLGQALLVVLVVAVELLLREELAIGGDALAFLEELATSQRGTLLQPGLGTVALVSPLCISSNQPLKKIGSTPTLLKQLTSESSARQQAGEPLGCTSGMYL